MDLRALSNVLVMVFGTSPKCSAICLCGHAAGRIGHDLCLTRASMKPIATMTGRMAASNWCARAQHVDPVVHARRFERSAGSAWRLAQQMPPKPELPPKRKPNDTPRPSP